jgi:hypothetical protein
VVGKDTKLAKIAQESAKTVGIVEKITSSFIDVQIHDLITGK